MKIRKIFTEKKEFPYNTKTGKLELGSPMAKIHMKAIGYRETNAKCCGTCNSYQGTLCTNTKNLKVFYEQEKLPPGVGLRVNSTGICPNYGEGF